IKTTHIPYLENQFLNCDFENDMCGWKVFNWDNNNKINWLRTNNNTISDDQTSKINPKPSKYGYFMYTEINPHMHANDYTILISQKRLTPKIECLTFWYRMFGNNTSLKVYVNEENSEKDSA